jgi:cell division protein FtsZ
MAFITAGMGGGTGTGGAPVVAKICKELGILTVGIVTLPFSYEGRKRMKQAQEGIDCMREYVDTILIISNDKLRQQFGNLPFTQAFAKADDVLSTAAKCITDVINTTGQINVDFADVCTVMRNGGVAILGAASAAGENRALHAVEEALNSPLLNDSDIRGAKWILLNITSAEGEHEHRIDEVDSVQAYVQQMAGDSCDVILGMGHDPNLGDRIAVTVIATGFSHKNIVAEIPIKNNEPEKVFMKLGDHDASKQTLINNIPAPKNPERFTPQLVEMPVAKSPFYSGIIDNAPNLSENKEVFTLNLNETSEATFKTENFSTQETPAEFEIVIREEASVSMTMTNEQRLTPEELEEKRRFEEQKRALEERAERLRKMSFNLKGNDTEHLENVPAYVRQNLNLDNSVTSADTFYSGYTIGFNDENANSQAGIQTINTFLDGKKPD